jgi:hypothetical protein
MNVTMIAAIRLLTILSICVVYLPQMTHAQALPITVTSDPARHIVTVTADGQPFTTFLYPDTLEKPVLYPIYAPDGQLITRGFPVLPRPGEPVDHPHHVGLWFNYENVNGLDFWNNSFAIPAEKKKQYGWIRTDHITKAGNEAITTAPKDPQRSGTAFPSPGARNTRGVLEYTARWTGQQNNVLLHEHTNFVFTATKTERIIDRTTTLTADVDVSFPDAKDGMLGLRVTKELQIPSNTPGEFVDDKGNITKVAAGNTPDINGNYLTSEGKTGDSAWGTRGDWCLLYGKKGPDTLSIAIISDPRNPGSPTYWHARGYGLFAANPLGQKVFSNGRETLNFKLAKGQSATFRYRIVLAAGDGRLSTGRIRQLTDDFTRKP